MRRPIVITIILLASIILIGHSYSGFNFKTGILSGIIIFFAGILTSTIFLKLLEETTMTNAINQAKNNPDDFTKDMIGLDNPKKIEILEKFKSFKKIIKGDNLKYIKLAWNMFSHRKKENEKNNEEKLFLIETNTGEKKWFKIEEEKGKIIQISSL